jgi:peptidyl-prolyl cis-trans isomerase D
MILQQIRDRLSSALAILILGILVIPFAFVGINSYFSAGGLNVLARVNDVDITGTAFNQSFQEYRREMQSRLGASFDASAFDQPLIRRQHLDAMVDREILTQTTIELGLDLDDDRLAEQIKTIPAFQVDGVFNADVYQSRLSVQGLTPKQFERNVRTQIIMGQLPSAIGGSSVAMPSEMKEFARLQEQTRAFNAVVINTSGEDLPEEISDEEIQVYFDENQDAFKSEEQVIVEYLELDVADMDSPPAPDEEALQSRFEAQKGRFLSAEKRLASHILIEVTPVASDADKETARQLAEDLSKRAREGEDFAALATEFSQDQGSAPAGGDLGWQEPGFMVKAFEDALYELTMDQAISEPVQSGFGWHVIWLREIEPSTGMSYEEARETILLEYETEEKERAFIDKADRLVDLIYEDPTTLDSAALTLAMEVKTTLPFGRNGGSGISENPDVVAAAFSDLVLLQDSVSDPVNLSDNHLVMIRIKEHLLPETKPFEEVSEEIEAILIGHKSYAAAEARAQALMAELQAGEGDLAALAEANELELLTYEAATRRGFEPDAGVVAEVFRLQPPEEGEVTRAVVPAVSGFALIELSAVTDGVLAEGEVLIEQQYQRQIANGMAAAEAEMFMQQLRAATEIVVYEDRL